MKAQRRNDRIVISFAPAEAQLMRRIFASIVRHYALKPDELHPSVAAAWYSTRGCASARMDEEQTQEWLMGLHGLKSANAEAVRRWKNKLAPRETGSIDLEFSDEEAHTLLTVLNDHRLMCGARHDIGETEMEIRTYAELEKVRPRKRAALIDIMFLGAMIETILALLPGNYGDWPLYAKQQ